MEAIGNNGRITIDGDKLIISRKGAGLLTTINLGFQGDKIIPLSQITAIELRPPGMFQVGYLRLSINGRDPVGGMTEAIQDENAVLISKAAFPAFEALKKYLVDRIGKPAAVQALSVADEIEKLAALRDRGLLTDEEFAASKLRVLNT